ncbi:neural cell adhesion molecule 1-like [Haliotis cracherodii]|uniref:neural cell adhesion molecule 1-like n=1 Tax=Haliotis cracherodii TaxID=6455 RepID=UPI0039ED96BD
MWLHIFVILSVHATDAYNIFATVGEDLNEDVEIPPATVMYVLSPSGEHLCVITENLEPTPGDRFICNNSSEGRVHLSLTNVTTSDAGVYKWTEASVKKTFGTIFTLFVIDTPTTPIVEANGTAVLLKPLTLKCLSNSSTVPGNHNLKMTYRWERNDEMIESNNVSTLQIKNFTWVNEQTFTCVSKEHGVSSQAGVRSITAERAPNEIRLTPNEIRFVKEVGESISIKCRSMTGCFPRCKTTWTQIGRVLSKRNTLTITQLVRSDQGNYTCQKKNKHGQTNKGVQIYVEYGPEAANIHHEENTTLTPLGSSVTLTCTADCRPPCQFAWSMDGRDKASGDSLRISEVHRNETGNYTCRAWNTRGEANATFQLIVKYLSEISVAATNTAPTAGSNIRLTCIVDSLPPPNVTWLRGNTLLSSRMLTISEADIQVDSSSNTPTHNYTYSYNIDNAKCLGKVTYTCAVTNGVGLKRSKNIDIDFTCAPFVNEPKGVEASIFYRPADKSDKIHFNITANPKPTFIWSRSLQNGNLEHKTAKSINKLSGSSYQLELVHLDVQEKDAGNYIVKLTNRLGKYDINYTLIVQVPPSPPTNLTEMNVTQTTVTLSWLPGFDGHAVQTFKISCRRGTGEPETTETSSTSLTLSELNSDVTYFIRVQGVNIAGEGNYSEDLVVATLEKDGSSQDFTTVFTVVLVVAAMVLVAAILICLTYLFLCGPCRSKRPVKGTKATYEVTNDTEEAQVDLWAAVATDQNMLVSVQDVEKPKKDPKSAQMYMETVTYTRLSESEAQRESLSCTTFSDEANSQRRSFMYAAFNDANRRGSLILTTYKGGHANSTFPVKGTNTVLPYPPPTNEDIQDDCFPYPPVEYEGVAYPPPPLVNEEVEYEGFAYPPLTYGDADHVNPTPYVSDATLPGRSHNAPAPEEQCGNSDSFATEEDGGNIYMNM